MGTGFNYRKKPTLLDAVVMAGKLLKHTRDIIKNPKVFDPARDVENRLLVRIYDTALDVNGKAFTANELWVSSNPRIAAERLALQAGAIASCECLLGLMADARVAFGLDSDKFWNWVGLAKETLSKLQPWHESDIRRYGELASRCWTGIFPRTPGAEDGGTGLESSFGGQRPPAVG